jgi:hypothetical protein
LSKKKTPQEKKQAAYEKDHYAFAWSSPHGFRKTWKKKKNQINRVIRRKSKSLLHPVGNSTHDHLAPEKESLTAELFRKGLSRKKLRKTGVVNLREKIENKRERRESSFNLEARSRAARAAGFRKFVTRLLNDREYTEENMLELVRLVNFSRFRKFLAEEPSWIPKLEQWMLSAQRRIAWRQLKSQRQDSSRD